MGSADVMFYSGRWTVEPEAGVSLEYLGLDVHTRACKTGKPYVRELNTLLDYVAGRKVSYELCSSSEAHPTSDVLIAGGW